MKNLRIQVLSTTWIPSGTTAWATGTNWTGGAPANDLTTDIAVFDSTTFTIQPNYGTTSVNGIQVGSGSATGTLADTSSSTTSKTTAAVGRKRSTRALSPSPAVSPIAVTVTTCLTSTGRIFMWTVSAGSPD